jgi:hypothetical protein
MGMNGHHSASLQPSYTTNNRSRARDMVLVIAIFEFRGRFLQVGRRVYEENAQTLLCIDVVVIDAVGMSMLPEMIFFHCRGGRVRWRNIWLI